MAQIDKGIPGSRVRIEKDFQAEVRALLKEISLGATAIGTTVMAHRGYSPLSCAEIAREGHETGKSLHDIVVKDRKFLTQEKWDQVF